MTTQLDAFVGLAKETTYGTVVTPTSFVEFTEETLEYKPTFTDATGLRPGRRTTTGTQRTISKKEYSGDLTVEATSGMLGVVLAAFFGQVTHTLLAGATYQHLFQMSADYLPSYTIQKGIPTLGGGAAVPFTFSGMQCSALELNAANAAIPTVKSTWMGSALSTATAAATPVYPTVTEEFTFVGGSIAIGGTVVPPTTTALATGGTSVATVTDVDLKFDNALDSGGFTLGGGGARTRPGAALLGKFTGTITAEFRDQTFWNNFVGQAHLALVLDFDGSQTGDGFTNHLQVVLPIIDLEGETPKIKAGAIVTQSVSFTALQDMVNGYGLAYAVLRNKVAAV